MQISHATGSGRRPRVFLLAVLALLVSLVAFGCGDDDSDATANGGGGSSAGGKLDVVGYSTPEAVYEEALEPGFEATPEGEGVSFSNSFGASGDQSRAVEAGQPASVVHFAQGGDMDRARRSRPGRARTGTRTSTRASPRTRSS